MKTCTKVLKFTLFEALFLLTFSSMALAQNADLPWEGLLHTVVNSINGPVAKLLGIAAIIITALMLAFGEAGGGFRRLAWVGLCLVVAFAAVTLVTNLFNFTGTAITI